VHLAFQGVQGGLNTAEVVKPPVTTTVGFSEFRTEQLINQNLFGIDTFKRLQSQPVPDDSKHRLDRDSHLEA
jgi:hypothetical protein